MPYNTTAIPPRKEVTGQTQLPLTRVKKIIAMDPDITVCSNNAAFAITLATEMFVQYLTEEAQKMTKLDRKPRRNIQYKDMANAIAHRDNLEFLEDVVPKTAPYKEVKAKAAAARAKMGGGGGVDGGNSNSRGTGDAGATAADDRPTDGGAPPSGKRAKSSASSSTTATLVVNGHHHPHHAFGTASSSAANGGGSSSSSSSKGKGAQQQQQQSGRHQDGDVDMTG